MTALERVRTICETSAGDDDGLVLLRPGDVLSAFAELTAKAPEAKSSNERSPLEVLLMDARSTLRQALCPQCKRSGCVETNLHCDWCVLRFDLNTTLMRFPGETPGECAACAQHEKDMTQELESRDRNADYADQLTTMIGVYFETDHGEHSNLNEPWENAIETMRVAIGKKQCAGPQPIDRAIACLEPSERYGIRVIAGRTEEFWAALLDGFTQKAPGNPTVVGMDLASGTDHTVYTCASCGTELAFANDICGLCHPEVQP